MVICLEKESVRLGGGGVGHGGGALSAALNNGPFGLNRFAVSPWQEHSLVLLLFLMFFLHSHSSRNIATAVSLC